MFDGRRVLSESVAERLEKVERQLRWAKVAGVVVLLLVGAGVMMGQAVLEQRVYRAEKLVLIDAGGSPRGVLGLTEDDSVALCLYDEREQDRARLSVSKDGVPRLVLRDKQGKLRAHLGLAEDGTPRLTLLAREGNRRISVKLLGPDGRPGLFLSDGQGDDRAGLTLLPGDRPFLSLTDEGQNHRTWMGPGYLQMFAEGRPRAWMGAPESGTPAFCLRDRDGKFRAELRLDADGSPMLKLTDKDGRELFTAP